MSVWAVLVTAIPAVLIALFITLRSGLTQSREGKMLAFVGLLILPVICVAFGFQEQIDRAESTKFCLSCHVMTNFGRSLYVDDPSYIPARHFQNNFVPRTHACYTCHTNYAMFGTARDKMRGLHHVMVQYFGRMPKPEDIKLYVPYNNRECLHCHLGARRFEESTKHLKDPTLLAKVKENRVSCLSSRCHDTIHEVRSLGDAPFWSEKP